MNIRFTFFIAVAAAATFTAVAQLSCSHVQKCGKDVVHVHAYNQASRVCPEKGKEYDVVGCCSRKCAEFHVYYTFLDIMRSKHP